ncbi:MAG: hypothetical protein IPN90_13290, partial [Elusimicrobia bacterium]|nr:hypothetical protein [Elusimicrobiota bacterium]
STLAPENGKTGFVIEGVDLDRLGVVKNASVSALLFDVVEGGGKFSGFVGYGTVTNGGKDVRVGFFGAGEMSVLDSYRLKGLVRA